MLYVLIKTTTICNREKPKHVIWILQHLMCINEEIEPDNARSLTRYNNHVCIWQKKRTSGTNRL